MAYLTVDELKAQIVPGDALTGISDPQILAVIEYASSLADSYFRKRYTLPFVSYGFDIKLNVGNLAQFFLMSRRGFRPGSGNDDIAVKRYDDAVKWLVMVAKGEVETSGVDSTEVDEDGSLAASETAANFRFNTGRRHCSDENSCCDGEGGNVTYPIGVTVQENGVDVASQQTILNFTGDVSVSYDGTKVTLNFTGGGGGGGISDGNKGDITVFGSGANWAVNNGAVSLAKMAARSADIVIGRTGTSGTPEEIAFTAVARTLAAATTQAGQRSALGLGTLATQNGTFSGTSSGTNTGDQTITLSGDVTGSGTAGVSATIANDAITTAKIQDGQVTLAKMAAMATASFLARATGGSGAPEVLSATQATALLNTFSSSLKGLAPASGGGTTNFLRADGSWAAPPGGGGSVNSASNVNVDGVGIFKQQTGADLEFRGINAASSKVTTVLDATNNTIDIDVTEANLTLGNMGGTVDATRIASNAVTTAKILDGNVTLAKLANIGTDRLIGRDSASSGVPEEISVGGGLEFSGSIAIQRSALTGDVSAAAGSNSTTIADNAVSLAKMADIATATILGRVTAGTGDPEALTGTQATTLLDAFTTSLKGLAPASGGGTTNYLRADGTWAAPPGSLADGSVTLAKLANLAALSVIGNGTNASATPTAIAAANDGEVLRRAGTAVAFGTLATAGIADNAVTLAKLATQAALSVLANATNGAAVPTAVAAASDYQVLRRSGTALAFGAISLDQSAAVTGTLPVANGGTGLATITSNALTKGNGTGAQVVTGITVDSNNNVSGAGVVYNDQTGTTYTLQASDQGKCVRCTNASAIAVTAPNTLPAGFQCEIEQGGAGKVTVSGGATLNNRQSQYATAGQYGIIGLRVRSNSGGTSAIATVYGDTGA